MASAAVKTAMLLALLAATAGSCRAGGVDVVVFGDSWGTEGAASFAKMAAAHGLTVHNAAVGGTTTGSWASKPDSLKNAVDAAGGAKHVWLTIGGNDAIDGLIAGGNVHTILEQATSNLQVFLQPLLTAYPSIGVVQFGYDVVNFKIDLCPLLGDAIFGHMCTGGSANITCDNTQFLQIQQWVENVSTAYPQHTAVNLLGTMQAGSGSVPGAAIGKPNLAYWTPGDLIQSSCIHANDKGYDMVFAALWDAYFAKHYPGQ